MRLNYYLLALLLLGLDQLSKILIFGYLLPGESMVLSQYFSLTHVHNHGAAFSFLADASGWQRYFLVAFSAIVSVVIVIWMAKTHHSKRLRLSALAILLGGALGNLYDRASLGMVVDFIDLHYGSFYWPVFNLADMFIVLGVIILLFFDKDDA